jgi:serine/threonine-protein kinase
VVRIFPLPLPGRRRYAAREQFAFGWGWYYAMELLKGGSLENRLTQATTVREIFRAPRPGVNRLNVLETVGIGRQIAAALDHIHEQNVINLDVKPGNVLFRDRKLEFLRSSVRQAVLCDFGIARDVRYPRAGMLGVATPEYVSPEQASEARRDRQPVDARSDIFSLGTMLYEGLTGQLPFDDPSLVVHPSYMPPPPTEIRPSIPKRLEKVVMRALAKDPKRRFQTAREMEAALERVPTPADWGATARRTFAGLTLIACVAAGGWGVRKLMEPREQPPTPTRDVTEPTAIPATATPAASPTPVATSTAAVSPTAAVLLTAEQEGGASTSTPRPTLTPTNTPLPTDTPIPEGG